VIRSTDAIAKREALKEADLARVKIEKFKRSRLDTIISEALGFFL
jgi:hypothetical protein